MAHREDALLLSQRVKDLEEELEQTKKNAELTEKEVQALKETCIVQQANLAKVEEETEALVAQHNAQLTRVQFNHTEEVENLNRALRKETAALEELEGQIQAQKSESEQALSRLSSSVDILEAQKKLLEAQHAAEIQKMEEAMATEKAELEKQLGTSQQEVQLLHETKQELESANIDLHSRLVSLQEEYSKMEEHNEEQVLALQQLVNLKENYTRDDAQERKLKTLQAELALAIHDLTAKEQECWELQEKVDQIEEGLNDSEVDRLIQDLENLKDQRHELQNQLKSTEGQLVEGRDQLLKTNQENAQLKLARDQLNEDLARAISEANSLRQQLQKLEEEALKKRDEQSIGEESTDGVILNVVPIEEPVLQEVRAQETYELLLPSSMLDQSANTSHSSQDTTQHEEIVKQMKSQLEELQSILIGRHPDDSSSSELSLVQELLVSNQSLLAQLRQKQRNEPHLQVPTIPKASEMAASLLDSLSAELIGKVDHLGRRITAAATTVSQVQFTLEERDARHMSALDGLLENSITPIDANLEDVDSSPSEADKKIEAMEMKARILTKEVETLKGQKVRLEKALSDQSLAMDQQLTETEQKITLQEEIIQRMKLEMEKLNYHLGKAKSLQNHYDDDRLEKSKQLEDKEREIVNKSYEIEQLREEVRKVCSPQPAQVDSNSQQAHEAELLMVSHTYPV